MQYMSEICEGCLSMNHQFSASLTVATSSRWGWTEALGLVAKLQERNIKDEIIGRGLSRNDSFSSSMTVGQCGAGW